MKMERSAYEIYELTEEEDCATTSKGNNSARRLRN